MHTFTVEVRPRANQLKILLPFKYVAPIIGIHYHRYDKLMYITVPSLDKIDVRESYILLEILKTIMYKATNNLPIPTTLTVEIPEIEAIEMAGDGKPILVIYGDDDDEWVDWNTMVYSNKDVFIELSYETSYYSDDNRDRARFYRLRNLGNVLSIGFRFLKPLTDIDAFMYAHFAAFVVHQMCNGRFKGPGPFEEFTSVEILDNIEKPFSPSLVRELLKQLKCLEDPDFRFVTVQEVDEWYDDFCEICPECCG